MIKKHIIFLILFSLCLHSFAQGKFIIQDSDETKIKFKLINNLIIILILSLILSLILAGERLKYFYLSEGELHQY